MAARNKEQSARDATRTARPEVIDMDVLLSAVGVLLAVYVRSAMDRRRVGQWVVRVNRGAL